MRGHFFISVSNGYQLFGFKLCQVSGQDSCVLSGSYSMCPTIISHQKLIMEYSKKLENGSYICESSVGELNRMAVSALP